MAQREVDMVDILDEWLSSDQSELVYENITITSEGLEKATSQSPDKRMSSIWQYLQLKDALDSNNVAHIDKKIVFRNVTSGPLVLVNIALRSLFIEHSTIESIRFDSLIVDSLKIENVSLPKGLRIYYSSISEYLRIRATSEASASILKSAIPAYININNSTFDSFIITQVWSHDLNEHLVWRKDTVFWGVQDNPSITIDDFPVHPHDQHAYSEDHHVFNLSSNNFSLMHISKSTLPKHHLRIYSELDKVDIRENTLGAVSISSNAKFSELLIKHNFFTTGLILDKHLAEVLFEIHWPDVDRKLRIGTDTLYYPTSHEVISNISHFEALSKAYSSIHRYYKDIGMLNYMNSTYIRWKDMQLQRYKYIYQTEGGFQKFFQWKLNSLLRVYTSYGTNPAQAIVVSIYLIFGFAVFYFFFPSDWDITSKKKLVSDYRVFIQKNEKGYVKPFFYLLGGFLISLLNAITLSLNSFITLGFGTIPTRGAARYVCVLQGFLGWFLLSIFTVALINQVLG
jgi:hypothetical protein